MFWVSFLQLFVLSTATVGQADWQPALDKLAPLLARFRVDSNERLTEARFVRVLARAGLQARYDEKTVKQTPGLYLAFHTGVVRLANAKDGLLVFLHRVKNRAEYFPNDSVIAIFFREQGKMRGEVVRTYLDPAEESGMPSFAILVRNRLLFSGEYAWMGNGPRSGVWAFKRRHGKWIEDGTKIAEFESWTPPELKLGADGKTVLPGRIVSRTYPKSLDAAHVSACLSYEEQWSFPNMKPRSDWKRLRDTPFNTLDALYGALLRNDAGLIRGHSLNPSVANRILSLGGRIDSGRPYPLAPNSTYSVDGKVWGLENLKATLHFVRKGGRWVVGRIGPISECK